MLPAVYRIREIIRTLQEPVTAMLEIVSQTSSMPVAIGRELRECSRDWSHDRGLSEGFKSAFHAPDGDMIGRSIFPDMAFSEFMRRCATVLLLLLVSTWSFAQDSEKSGHRDINQNLQVGVSVPPQKFLLEQIAGDLIEIIVMVDQGQSPHHYSPSPAKIRALADAELYFGAGLEEESHWQEKFLGANAQLKWVEAPAGHHQWLSPALVRESVHRMTDELIALRPQATDRLEKGRRALVSQLDQLDEDLSTLFDQQTRGKTFIANHEAWAAIAQQYQLSMMVVHQDGKSPSVRDLARIISTAQQLAIDVVISDAGHNDKSARQIAEAVGGRVVTLNPVEESWFDNIRQAATVIHGALK